MHRSFIENMTTMPPLTGNAGNMAVDGSAIKDGRKE
jgi:hypothetical protein